jgi:hypothetical protein
VKLPPEAVPPPKGLPRREAQHLGCTCQWWGDNHIVDFDEQCPILERHRSSPGREKRP